MNFKQKAFAHTKALEHPFHQTRTMSGLREKKWLNENEKMKKAEARQMCQHTIS